MPPSRILLSLGEHVSEGMARQLEELARVLDAYGADKYGGLAQMIDDFRAGKPGAEEKLTVYLEDLRDEASTLQLESPGSHAMARDFEQAGMGAGGEFQDAQTRDFLQNEMGMQYEDTGKLIDDPLEAADEGMDPFPARRNDFGQESFEEPDFGGFGDPSPAVSGGIRTREPSAYTQAYDDILAGRTPNWAAVENAPGARTLRDLYFLVKEDPEIARHLKEGAEPGAVSGETGGFYPTPNRGRGQSQITGGTGTPAASPGLRKIARERSQGLTDEDLYPGRSAGDLASPEAEAEMRRISAKLGFPPNTRFQELPAEMQAQVARELGFPAQPRQQQIEGVDIGGQAPKGPAFRDEYEADEFFSRHPEMETQMRERFRTDPRTVERTSFTDTTSPEEYEQLLQGQMRRDDPFIGSGKEAAAAAGKSKGRLETLLERQPGQDDYYRFEGAQELAEDKMSRLPGYADEPVAEAKYAQNAVARETERLSGLLNQKGFMNMLRELVQSETLTASEAGRLRDWATSQQPRIMQLATTQAEELLTNQNWNEIARIFRWDNKRLNHMVKQFQADPQMQQRFQDELTQHFSRQVLAEQMAKTLGRRVGRRVNTGYDAAGTGVLPPKGPNAFSEQDWLDYYAEAGTPIRNQEGESRRFRRGIEPGQTYRPEMEQRILREISEGAETRTPVPRTGRAIKELRKQDSNFDELGEGDIDWLNSPRYNAEALQDEIIRFKDGSYTIRPQSAAWVPGEEGQYPHRFFSDEPDETLRISGRGERPRGNTILPRDVEDELARMRSRSEQATKQRGFSRKRAIENRKFKDKGQAGRDHDLDLDARTQTWDRASGESRQTTKSVREIFEVARENAEARLRRPLTRSEEVDLEKWATEQIPLETRVIKNVGGADLGREGGRRSRLLEKREKRTR